MGHLTGMLPWALLGGVALTLALRATFVQDATGHNQRSPYDLRLLGGWATMLTFGVIATHNFAAPRYLLPAMCPLALLVCLAIEQRRDIRSWTAVGLGINVLLALVLTTAEHRYAHAQDTLAKMIGQAHPEGGHFSGEWTFRWRMEALGWQFLTSPPKAGALIAVTEHGSPAMLPSSLERITKYESTDEFPVRVLCAPCGVGLYGETIGSLPLAWAPGPIETITLWEAH